MNNKNELCSSMYTNDLLSFVQLVFTLLNPGRALIPAFYIEEITRHLQLADAGESSRITVSLPPRHLKSMITSVAFSVWTLARQPKAQVKVVVDGHGARRDIMRLLLQLIQHPKFLSLFPYMDITSSTFSMHTRFGGSIEVCCVYQSLGSSGADMIIIDDPVSSSKVLNRRKLEAANDWFDNTVYQRLNDNSHGVVVVAMSRMHVDDMIGHITRTGNWTNLSYSAIALEDEYRRGIRVRKKCYPLNPSLHNFDEYVQIMKAVGAKPFMAHYQQVPYSDGDGDGRGGYHQPLRKGISWRVGAPRPVPWFGRVPQEQIVLHEVFGIGEHPWPEDMRDACDAEHILVHGSDLERYDLIKLMTPKQRKAHGIHPSGDVFPDFTEYNTPMNEKDMIQSRVHNPGFCPVEKVLFQPLLGYEIYQDKGMMEEIRGFEDPLPEHYFNYG